MVKSKPNKLWKEGDGDGDRHGDRKRWDILVEGNYTGPIANTPRYVLLTTKAGKALRQSGKFTPAQLVTYWSETFVQHGTLAYFRSAGKKKNCLAFGMGASVMEWRDGKGVLVQRETVAYKNKTYVLPKPNPATKRRHGTDLSSGDEDFDKEDSNNEDAKTTSRSTRRANVDTTRHYRKRPRKLSQSIVDPEDDMDIDLTPAISEEKVDIEMDEAPPITLLDSSARSDGMDETVQSTSEDMESEWLFLKECGITADSIPQPIWKVLRESYNDTVAGLKHSNTNAVPVMACLSNSEVAQSQGLSRPSRDPIAPVVDVLTDHILCIIPQWYTNDLARGITTMLRTAMKAAQVHEKEMLFVYIDDIAAAPVDINEAILHILRDKKFFDGIDLTIFLCTSDTTYKEKMLLEVEKYLSEARILERG
ncbi:hypothetical protein MMC18_005962 [Xylographa bjoerkii]|nr:hypothetical protein [Xylographa bjoerkii]